MEPDITLYWITAAAGILLSGVLFVCLGKRGGFSPLRCAAGFLLGLALALLFAKGVYVCFYYSSLSPYGFGKWLRFVPKEFSFVSGAAGFCLGPVLVSLRRRKEIPSLLDCLAAPGCLLCAFLRFAEVFLGQLGLCDVYSLGLPDIAEGSFLARFPFAARDAWGVWYLSVSALAALCALWIGLAAFLRLKNKKARLQAGLVFERAAFLLCSVRFFLELTRMECLVFYFVHLDQALCAVVMLGLLIRLGLRLRKAGKRFPVPSLILFLLFFALNGVTQYAMDKPWKFRALFSENAFRWLNENLSWFGFALLLATTAGCVLIYLRLWRRARHGGITPPADP